MGFFFCHFLPIFVLLKVTCLVTPSLNVKWDFFCDFQTTVITLLDCKLQVFKNSSKLTTFGVFNQLLSTQNVNVARFARNFD